MVGVFGRKKNSQNDAAAASTGADAAAASPAEETAQVSNPAEAKKNRPTPKRSQQQAARRQPLVGDNRREANKQAKAEIRRKRDEARIGLMEGNEKYLGPRDRGPQRRYVRDFVDARFSIGELFIPFAFVVLLIGFIINTAQVQVITSYAVYGLIVLVIIDCFILNYVLKGRMATKFGGKEKLERGLTFYAVMRAVQLRVLRIPKPQVKRGQYPS
ncbi:DUF3043 domain-containing protein [Brevibacterium otitidis]|uniref:DUF3043 domain-containing protein n=1 Tax=Brevibacterium otitidis TaxID=53364 RepID=A0ABV5WY65_9MICO